MSLLYLHGFCSSPASIKARQLAAHLAARGLAGRFACPQLAHQPAQAIAQAEALIAAMPAPPTLVGSSLGGYYATHLAEKHGLHAVLVNPAVVAPRSLTAYLGEQTNLYTGERFLFTEAHIAQLRALEARHITPERYLLLVETGDEVLDYRDAVTRYAGCRQVVIEGGDHGFQAWPLYLDAVLAFAGL